MKQPKDRNNSKREEPFFHFLLQIVRRGADDLIHIVIAVQAQVSAEDHISPGNRQFLIFGVKSAVFCTLYRVAGFQTGMPFCGVFPAYEGGLLYSKLEIPVLNDPGTGNLPGDVVDGSVAPVKVVDKALTIR